VLKSEPARCGHDNPDKQHMKSRILLADDHQLFREALCHLLNSQPDLEVAGQVGNGLEVIEQARLSEADVVCMDINMPGMDGIEITRRLIAALPQVKVVALSAYSDQQYVLDMLHAGAMAYVTKGEASDELLRAIHAVLRGRTYLCPDVAGVVAAAVVGQGGRRGRLPAWERASGRYSSSWPKDAPPTRLQKCSALRLRRSMCTGATSCASSTGTAWRN